jgi:glycosyltransferase involved in cell wall biosynthesis
MRIALLAYRGSMTSGGQGIYVYNLTAELAKRGHEIDCFVGPPYPDPMPWARTFHVENQEFWGKRFQRRPGAFLPRPDPLRILHPLNFYEFAVTRFGFLPEPFAFSLRAARAVMRQISEGRRYDVVHDVQSLSYGLLWLRALGLPVTTTVHHPLSVDRRASLDRDRTFAERKGSLTFYPVRTQRRVARRLDAVLTSSRASASELVQDYRVDPERVHIVWNGVELPPLAPFRPHPAQDEILFVGRVGDPNKGIEFLFDALAKLPPSITLRVLDTPPTGTPLARRIRDLGIEDRIRFEGKLSREDLERAYRRAAVVALPSLYEGFGLPAIEALASLVPPRDPAALAAAITRTLRVWKTEHERAYKARSRIEAAFSWASVAERTENVYRTITRPAAS